MTEQQPVCLVTGANSGIGYETTRALARAGCAVIMVCRDLRRGQKAQEQIISQTGSASVHLLLADLSSQSDIHKLIRTIKSDFPTLQIMINNAGAIFYERKLTIDGLEQTFALNHMAYFALTNGLLPVLQVNAPARIINVGSFAARGTQLNFDDLQAESDYDGVKAYQNSKLANILFTTELARRLDQTRITVNCYNPGNVMTNFGGFTRNLKIYIKRVFFPTRYSAMHLVPVERTGKDIAYLVLDDTLSNTSGMVFSSTEIDSTLTALDDRRTAGQLWDASEDLLQYPLIHLNHV